MAAEDDEKPAGDVPQWFRGMVGALAQLGHGRNYPSLKSPPPAVEGDKPSLGPMQAPGESLILGNAMSDISALAAKGPLNAGIKSVTPPKP
jgi:hypothetical protein